MYTKLKQLIAATLSVFLLGTMSPTTEYCYHYNTKFFCSKSFPYGVFIRAKIIIHIYHIICSPAFLKNQMLYESWHQHWLLNQL